MPIGSFWRARAVALTSITLCGVLLPGCGGDDEDDAQATGVAPSSTASRTLDRVVNISGNRTLYVRCSGSGAPTVVLEGGDGDTSDSYGFAEARIANVTRTCVYDRANLGRSGPDPGPRGLRELVRDLERLLQVADIPAPYVLVGTSGGGFITAGYAVTHPDEVAGLVLVDTGAPLQNPPREIVAATAPNTRRTLSIVITYRSRKTPGQAANGSVTCL